MSKILQKGAKLLIIGYLITLALSIVLACFYLTQYNEIHIFSSLDKEGNIVYSSNDAFYKDGPNNDYLFRYFNSKRNKDTESPFYEAIQAGNGSSIINQEYKDGMTYAQFIDEFRININSYNDSIITYGMVVIVICILLFIFANHSRKIYYASNLVIGVGAPLAIGIYSGVMLFNNMSIQNVFNSNIDLFRVTVAMQTSEMTSKDKNALMAAPKQDTGDIAWNLLVDKTSDVNELTFNIANALFILIIVFSLLMIVFTVLKYKATSKRRLEVIERAVQKND